MPLLEDLSVYEDGDVFSVYDHSFEDEDAAQAASAAVPGSVATRTM